MAPENFSNTHGCRYKIPVLYSFKKGVSHYISIIADNYLKAMCEGEYDDWLETDMQYYEFEPSLCDCLQEFLECNKEIIFG